MLEPGDADVIVHRRGRIHVTQDVDGTIWVGAGTITCIRGEVDI